MGQLLVLIALGCVVGCALLFIIAVHIDRIYRRVDQIRKEIQKHGSHLENPDSDEMP